MFLLFFVLYCKNKDSVQLYLQEPFPEKLSEWNLFTGKISEIKPNKGLIPYDLITPLFSDYASKSRFIWMPNGKSALYKENETFEFPVGTIISKTFYYPGDSIGYPENSKKIIETRLLIRTESEWIALPYIWNEEMSEANLEITGGKRLITYKDKSGRIQNINYSIPNTNQCKGCHENDKELKPIGPKAINLNRDFTYEHGVENQLEYFKKIGYVSNLPDSQSIKSFEPINLNNSKKISEQARGYLDVNCAHCHNPKGPANTSGLMLNESESNPFKLGFCKTPIASGKGSGNLKYDIVPGKPGESILLHRMNSEIPDIMMPELGRSIIHAEGIQLIKKWIESEKGNCI